MSDHLKKADDVLARAQANSEPAETTRSAQAQPTASTKAREALGKRDATLSGAPKPRAKPKPDIAIAKGSADDNRATPLERTIAALAKLDFTFTYDLFRHQYHVGDHALQQRIGENVEHAIWCYARLSLASSSSIQGLRKSKPQSIGCASIIPSIQCSTTSIASNGMANHALTLG